MYLLETSERAREAANKRVQVREYVDGAVRIFFGGVELTARPFPKDSRVSQAAVVGNKFLAGALSAIQRQQQERDQRALEDSD